jgi:hypothetical protein
METTVLSQDTYAAFGLPLSGLGGSSDPDPTFSTVYAVSTITSTLLVQATANIFEMNAGSVSTIFFEADEAFISTISTVAVVLDGSVLTTVGTELLLNGIPLATTSNLSSIADWALDPAISTVNMNTNNLINGGRGEFLNLNVASTISCVSLYADSNILVGENGNVTLSGSSGTLNTNIINAFDDNNLTINNLEFLNGFAFTPPGGVGGVEGILQITGLSTINGLPYNTSTLVISSIQAQSANISSLNCKEIITNNLTAVSTIHAISSISSSVVLADSITVSSINGATFPQSIPNLANWANFAAVSTVNLNTHPVVDTAGPLAITANSGNLNLTADREFNIGTNSVVNLIARNGLGGTVNITGDSGFLGANGGVVAISANGGGPVDGLNGRVSILASAGSGEGISVGGVIELIATSGITPSNLTSKITLNGGGINIYSGAASPIGSVFGYTFLNATLGISLVVGDYSSPFQVPGTVYLYGDQGVVVGSPLYAYNILGYWSGVAPPSNLTITGRQTILGNSFVNISNVDHIYFDAGGAGALSGVQTINGNAYPPTPPAPSPDPVVSTLRVNPAGFISTVALEGLSTINGVAFPPELQPDADLLVSTILVNATGFISTLSLEGLSTINGAPFPNPDPEISTLTVNPDGFIDVVALKSVSTINDAPYPPPLPELEANLQVSTILVNADGYISTLALEGLSTINGVAFPPELQPDADLQVSTILVNATGFISTLSLEGLSTINGAPFPNPDPEISTLTVNPDGFIDVVALKSVSTINDAPYPPPLPELEANLQVSTILVNADGYISTLFLEGVSTINGAAYPPVAPPPAQAPDIQVSTILVNPTGYISTLFLEGISTINGAPFPNPDPQVSTLQTYGAGHISTSFIFGLVNINGAPYPPPGLREIQVSTITLAPNGFVSTLQLEGVSSINGVAYPPPGLGSIQVSSMTVASSGFISTPQVRTTGRSGLIIGEDPLATNNSGFILFNSSGHDTFDTGQTSLNKNSGLVNRNEPNSTISGLYVAVISTGLSTAQPLGCSEVYLYGVANSGSVLPVTLGYDNSIPALTVQAPSVNISSLVGVSSINGVPYRTTTSGKIPGATGSDILSTSVIGLVSTGIVIGQYNHFGGGVAHVIEAVVPGTDNCLFYLDRNSHTGDNISFFVANFTGA